MLHYANQLIINLFISTLMFSSSSPTTRPPQFTLAPDVEIKKDAEEREEEKGVR